MGRYKQNNKLYLGLHLGRQSERNMLLPNLTVNNSHLKFQHSGVSSYHKSSTEESQDCCWKLMFHKSEIVQLSALERDKIFAETVCNEFRRLLREEAREKERGQN